MKKRNDGQGIPVLTIDGPSGSGKGTIARRVAAELGWNLLDSGALYRLTALSAARNGRDGCPAAELAQFAAGLEVRFESTSDGDELIYLSGEEVSGEVRTEASGLKASNIRNRRPSAAAESIARRSASAALECR